MVNWSRHRKVESTITVDDVRKILELQENCCALSGVPFDEHHEPSIDRIDSNNGYHVGNIQLVLIEVNKMKMNISNKRFIELCLKIAKNQTEKVNLYRGGVRG